MSKEPTIRREKVDPADAVDTTETFLPGQIPVKDAESAQMNEARATEQQPDPAEAAKAVNPIDLADVNVPEDRKSGD